MHKLQELKNLSEGITALQTLDRYNNAVCILLLRFGLDIYNPLFLDRNPWSPALFANVGCDASRLVLGADSNNNILGAWLASLVRTNCRGIFFQILLPDGIGKTFFVFPDFALVAPVHSRVRIVGFATYTMPSKILFTVSDRFQKPGITLRIFFLGSKVCLQNRPSIPSASFVSSISCHWVTSAWPATV